MKRMMMAVAVGLVAASALSVAVTWGRKVTATTSPVAYAIPNADVLVVKSVSFYNSGTNDVAVGINLSTNEFYTYATNTTPSVAICPASQSLSFELTRSGTIPVEFAHVRNVVVMSYNDNSTVYITAY